MGVPEPRVVLDLGGILNQLLGHVQLDRVAASSGMAPGGTYRLDFFWAERKVVNSNFRIENDVHFTVCGALPATR